MMTSHHRPRRSSELSRSRHQRRCAVVGLIALAFVRPAQAQEQRLDDLFPTDRLVEFDIRVDEEDWDELRSQSRSFRTAFPARRQFEALESPYSYVPASVTIDGVEYPEVGIRKKGFFGSQDNRRPSLKIKLDYVDKDAELGGLNTLTLNNNKQDRSLMSQFMGYALFNAAGSPAPRCAYAKVRVNGDDLGVYCHVESLKKPMLEREFGSSKGTLFEGTVVDFYQDWEKSFERKSGKEKRGRRQLANLVRAIHDLGGDVVLGAGAPARAWAASHGDDDGRWFEPEFDDNAWRSGSGGVGYERDRGYEAVIGEAFDFDEEMSEGLTSVYLRIPFDLEDPGVLVAGRKLVLRMKFDDGFVAYLNGVEVARSRAPENVRWDSRATGSGDDRGSLAFANFEVDQADKRLRSGRNVLAIHVLNVEARSSDMLGAAELVATDKDLEQDLWQLVDEEAFYTFWALEGLLSFWDGYSGNRNNFFVYVNPKTDKLHFLPWGADCLFETYSQLGEDRRAPRSVRTQGLIPHRLYQLPQARQKYAARMRELLAEHWDEARLLAETERIQQMVEPHLSRAQRRTVNFDAIRSFIRGRHAPVEPGVPGGDMPRWDAPAAGPVIMEGRSRFGR